MLLTKVKDQIVLIFIYLLWFFVIYARSVLSIRPTTMLNRNRSNVDSCSFPRFACACYMFFLLVASRRYVFAICSYQVLDYEANSSYSLIVDVSDGPATVSQPLTISIRDVNDPPIFTDAPYALNVNENEVAGAVYTVSATDQDAGKCVREDDTSRFLSLVRVHVFAAFSFHTPKMYVRLTRC